jgi:hypothetical protein
MTKRTNILVGYSCAILATAFFGSVSTVSKPLLATVNPVLLSGLTVLNYMNLGYWQSSVIRTILVLIFFTSIFISIVSSIYLGLFRGAKFLSIYSDILYRLVVEGRCRQPCEMSQCFVK